MYGVFIASYIGFLHKSWIHWGHWSIFGASGFVRTFRVVLCQILGCKLVNIGSVSTWGHVVRSWKLYLRAFRMRRRVLQPNIRGIQDICYWRQIKHLGKCSSRDALKISSKMDGCRFLCSIFYPICSAQEDLFFCCYVLMCCKRRYCRWLATIVRCHSAWGSLQKHLQGVSSGSFVDQYCWTHGMCAVSSEQRLKPCLLLWLLLLWKVTITQSMPSHNMK